MLTSDLPRTIDEAELAGWQGLDLVCTACRSTVVIPWPLLKRRTKRRDLSEIKARLTCERCGAPPAKVSLTRSEPQGHGSPASRKLEI